MTNVILTNRKTKERGTVGTRRGSNKKVKPEPTLSADPGFPSLVPGFKSMKDLILYSLLFLLLQEVLDEIPVDRKTKHL